MPLIAFTPGASVTTAITTTQTNITLGGVGHYVRIVNSGGGLAYVGFYEATQAPPTLNTTTTMLIPSGAIEVFSVASDTTRIAVLGDATGSTINVTRGEGA